MKVSFIVALTRDGVMGKNNALPWHLPEDLKRFKQLTLGKPIVMGRKTYDSIGRPLPGRKNIVISRNSALKIPGVECVTSFHEAKKLCSGAPEICVIGGAEIFRITVEEVTDLYLTWVEKPVEGDVYFPKDFPWQKFHVTFEEAHTESPLPYTYTNYERRPKGA